MKQDRLLKVLAGPVISEKSTMLAEKNRQYTFRVVPCATKAEVKAAVELLFKVKVDGVQILNVKGKVKRAGRNGVCAAMSARPTSPLAQGQEINFAARGEVNGSRQNQTDVGRPARTW